MLKRLLGLVALTVVGTGCASMSPVGTARTLDEGTFRYGGELITGSAVVEREDFNGIAFQMGASLTYGITMTSNSVRACGEAPPYPSGHGAANCRRSFK